MTTGEAKQVERYFEAGYMVKIGGTGFVDSEVQDLFEDNEELVYNSETFDERPLSEVEMYDVSILMPLYSIATGKPIAEIGDQDEYELKIVDGKEV